MSAWTMVLGRPFVIAPSKLVKKLGAIAAAYFAHNSESAIVRRFVLILLWHGVGRVAECVLTNWTLVEWFHTVNYAVLNWKAETSSYLSCEGRLHPGFLSCSWILSIYRKGTKYKHAMGAWWGLKEHIRESCLQEYSNLLRALLPKRWCSRI